jgi:hypothetical protein
MAGLLVGVMAQQAGIAGALRLSTLPVVAGLVLLLFVVRPLLPARVSVRTKAG